MAKKKITADKKKKKYWVPIIATKEFKNVEIGETYVEDPKNCIGKTITTNLMIITKDSKKQNTNIKFKIKELKNNALQTEVISLNLQTAQLKRMAKKAKMKIEDSFVVNTKDNIKVRIKPILFTKSTTTKPTLTSLRKTTREIVDKFVKEISFTNLINDIISGQLQKAIKNDTKKIYPLAYCIFKKVERLN